MQEHGGWLHCEMNLVFTTKYNWEGYYVKRPILYHHAKFLQNSSTTADKYATFRF